MLQLLERARDAGGDVPLTVSSWWRSDVGNMAAGGASGSQHLTASAVDLVVDGDPAEWFNRVRVTLPASSFGQMIFYQATKRHIHLSLPNRSSGITGEQLVELSPKSFAPAPGSASFGAPGDSLEGVAAVTWPMLGYLTAGVLGLLALSRMME